MGRRLLPAGAAADRADGRCRCAAESPLTRWPVRLRVAGHRRPPPACRPRQAVFASPPIRAKAPRIEGLPGTGRSSNNAFRLDSPDKDKQRKSRAQVRQSSLCTALSQLALHTSP